MEESQCGNLSDRQSNLRRGAFAFALVIFSLPVLFLFSDLAVHASNPLETFTFEAAKTYNQVMPYLLLPATIMLAWLTNSNRQRVKAVFAGLFSSMFSPLVLISVPFLFLGYIFLASYIEQESPAWHQKRGLSNPFLWSRLSLVLLVAVVCSMFVFTPDSDGVLMQVYTYLPLGFFVASLLGIIKQLFLLTQEIRCKPAVSA